MRHCTKHDGYSDPECPVCEQAAAESMMLAIKSYISVEKRRKITPLHKLQSFKDHWGEWRPF